MLKSLAKDISSWKKWFFKDKKLIVAIIILGIVLRAKYFLANRSLWADEAVTAIKIMSLALYKMIQPYGSSFSDMHAYPAGFLFVEKLFGRVLGYSEYSLRLFPFICGIVSIFLFAQLCLKLFEKRWAAVAITAFSASTTLIYYSSELKPYSSDVMVALLLFFMCHKLFQGRQEKRTIYMFGGLGIVAILSSFPSIFILISFSICQLLKSFTFKEKKNIDQAIMVSLMWLLGFVVYYFMSLRYFYLVDSLSKSFNSFFMPFVWDVKPVFIWLIFMFSNVFIKNLQLPGLFALILFLSGIFFGLLKKDDNLRLLSFPIFFSLILAALKRYPFSPRTVLFLSPAFLIFIVKGAEVFCSTKRLKNISTFLYVALTICILFNPLDAALIQWFSDIDFENSRGAATYFYDNKMKGDVVFINDSAQYSYAYYISRLGLKNKTRIVNKISDFVFTDEKGKYLYFQEERYKFNNGLFSKVVKRTDITKLYAKELYKYYNPRTWIILTHVTRAQALKIEAFFNASGKKLKEFKGQGAAAYLYDLSRK